MMKWLISNRQKLDYSYVFVFIVSLLIIVSSLDMANIKSKIVPLVVASTMLVLSAIGFWLKIRIQHDEKEAIRVETEKKSKKGEARETLREKTIATFWIAGYLFSIYFLGLVAATPIFVFAYMRSHKIKLSTAIIWMIACTASTYLVFELLLEVELYRGILIPFLLK